MDILSFLRWPLLAFVAACMPPNDAMLRETAPQRIVIRNVSVFDGTSPQLSQNQTVLIENGKITSVGAFCGTSLYGDKRPWHPVSVDHAQSRHGASSCWRVAKTDRT
jgi:hypothetical protein